MKSAARQAALFCGLRSDAQSHPPIFQCFLPFLTDFKN
jgi:hypothetical protein